MKRLAIAVAILAVGAAGCGGGNGNPNNPSDITVFNVPLSAQNENPPISNAESTARGNAVITVNKATNTIDFSVSLNSFPAGSVVRIAHIHGPAPRTGNASIVVDTRLAPGDVTLSEGFGTFTFDRVTTTAAIISAILASPELHYFNVHTALNGGGAVRGQLR
jgi:hypothetical protein